MAQLDDVNGGFDYLTDFSYVGTGVQEVINLPFLPNGYVIQLTPTGGTAKVEASLDGTNWIEWNDGTVVASTATRMEPMRFLRVTNVTATSSRFVAWGKRNG